MAYSDPSTSSGRQVADIEIVRLVARSFSRRHSSQTWFRIDGMDHFVMRGVLPGVLIFSSQTVAGKSSGAWCYCFQSTVPGLAAPCPQ